MTDPQLTPRHDRLLKYVALNRDLTVLRLARVFLWSSAEIQRLLVDLEAAGKVRRDRQRGQDRWGAT